MCYSRQTGIILSWNCLCTLTDVCKIYTASLENNFRISEFASLFRDHRFKKSRNYIIKSQICQHQPRLFTLQQSVVNNDLHHIFLSVGLRSSVEAQTCFILNSNEILSIDAVGQGLDSQAMVGGEILITSMVGILTCQMYHVQVISCIWR